MKGMTGGKKGMTMSSVGSWRCGVSPAPRFPGSGKVISGQSRARRAVISHQNRSGRWKAWGGW